jgi:hypothetical protein
MKKIFWVVIAFLLCLVMANLYLYYQHSRITHIACQGVGTVLDEKYVLHAQISLSISGEIAQTVINGELTDKGGTVFPVHRSISSRVTQYDNSLYLTNNAVAVLPNDTADTSTLKILLPPYLLFNNISTRFDIYPIANKGYLITSSEYMHFYCTN